MLTHVAVRAGGLGTREFTRDAWRDFVFCAFPESGQAKKRWDAEMKDRGLSKDEAFMVETASAAEIGSEHKNKKEKHKAAFGESLCATHFSVYVLSLCMVKLFFVIRGRRPCRHARAPTRGG